MQVTTRLPRFTTCLALGVLLGLGGCTFREPERSPAVDGGGALDLGASSVDGAGNAGGATGSGRGGAGLGSGGHSGEGGRAGGQGDGGSSGDGGRSGSNGGRSGAGGRAGAGGAAAMGGQPGGGPGGASGTGGASPTVDGGSSADTVACGPVCAIFCPNGYVADERGCPTCTCKPPAACEKADCGLAPGAPNIMCSDGSIGGPICERSAEGRCGWTFRECPAPPPGDPCTSITTAVLCALDASCRWLEPGCTGPKLGDAGCYSKSRVGCSDTTPCDAGRKCTKRKINPCAATLGGVIPGLCNACAEEIAICL
jgi:hypothetical protein